MNSNLKKMKVDFLIPDAQSVHSSIPVGQASHVIMCLMQGFHALGHEVYTNQTIEDLSYSRGISMPFSITTKDFLQITDLLAHDLLIVDASLGYGSYADTISDIAIKKHRPVVLVNMADNANFYDFPDDFIVFCTHQNRFATRHGRIFPIGFGLSEDLIIRSATQKLNDKQDVIVRNFSPSFSQSVRDALELTFVENLAKFFEVDRKLTNADEYLAQLSQVAAVCAYGGNFVPDFRSHQYLQDRWQKSGSTEYVFKSFTADPAILRWDSWRFFEAAVMACAPIHLDFEKYGMQLPYNPEPWVHYIPIDLTTVSNLPEFLFNEVKKDPDFIKRIGRNSREWVIEHYCPSAQANYVLSIIRSIWPNL